ncbi:MAG: methylmalonyl Co-A mutase-associated GTPase MeaB, partial [Betaproteobacteria bacterium]|nr:methylmalonyl Co-A mutase-associated GTPase MeaB [Betaproteobacteria bacterium]
QFWDAVQTFRELQTGSGRFAARRQSQALAWMWERIDAGLKQDFQAQSSVQTLIPELTRQVLQGSLGASTAARRLLQAYGARQSPHTIFSET